MEKQTQIITAKTIKWSYAAAIDYIESLRESQIEDPAPAVLRAKLKELAGELYIDGYDCKEIADMTGISSSAVRYILHKNNIPLRGSKKKYSDEQKEQAVTMYKDGFMLKEIRKKTGIHSAILGKLLKKQNKNIPLRYSSESRTKMKADAIRMYKKGITLKEIQKKTGISAGTLDYTLKKANIPLRKKKGKQYTDEQEDEAIRLYRSGLTARKIEEKTGVKHTALPWMIKKNNIPVKRTKIPDKQVEMAVRMYQEGFSNREIREKTGVPEYVLINMLKKRNIPLKGSNNKPAKKQLSKAVRMYRDGYSLEEIKKNTGVGQGRLYKTLHEENLPLKGQTETELKMKEKAVAMYRDTAFTVKEIEEKTGVNSAALIRLLRKRNIPLRGKRLLDENKKEEAVNMYLTGFTIQKIKEKTGVNHACLFWRLRKNNIPLKGKKEKKITKEQEEQAIRMYQDGFAIKEIKKATGIPFDSYVYDTFKKNNVVLRRSSLQESGK